MKEINLVFMGNFLYPRGMASTKRIQHAIDYLLEQERENLCVSILLIRQSHPGRDDGRLSGYHKGVFYRTIGSKRQSISSCIIDFVSYHFKGWALIWKLRKKAWHNALYLYGVPSMENVFLALFARLIGFRIICDVVEESYVVNASSKRLSRFKAASCAFFARHIYLFADFVVVISSQLLNKFSHIVKNRIPVYLVPVTVDAHRIVFNDAGLHDPIRLLYSGSFGDKDDLASLFGALEQVRAEGFNAELWLTGRGIRQDMEKLNQRIQKSPSIDHIRFFGYLDDAHYCDILSACDIPCMVRVNSRYANSGFPFKLGEYLATGKPVIASNVGDVKLYLSHRISAFLVEPESSKEIAEAVKFIATHFLDARAVGKNGRKTAEKLFHYRSAWATFGKVFLHLRERNAI